VSLPKRGLTQQIAGDISQAITSRGIGLVGHFKLQPLGLRPHFGFGHRLIAGGSRSPAAVMRDQPSSSRQKSTGFRLGFPFKLKASASLALSALGSATHLLLFGHRLIQGDAVDSRQ